MLFSGATINMAIINCKNRDVCSRAQTCIRYWKVSFTKVELLLPIPAEPVLLLFLAYTLLPVLSSFSSCWRLLTQISFSDSQTFNALVFLFCPISTIAFYFDLRIFPLPAPKIILFLNGILLNIYLLPLESVSVFLLCLSLQKLLIISDLNCRWVGFLHTGMKAESVPELESMRITTDYGRDFVLRWGMFYLEHGIVDSLWKTLISLQALNITNYFFPSVREREGGKQKE